jgi:hypothetical protein
MPAKKAFSTTADTASTDPTDLADKRDAATKIARKRLSVLELA